MRTRAAVLLAVLTSAACRRHPPARAPEDGGRPLAWTARSASGRATVQQRGEGDACVLESAGGGEAWSAPVCAATAEQLPFVSEDGQWLLVLDPLPPVREGRWQEADAISLFHRGELRIRAPVGDLVRGPRGLHFFVGTVGWLGGTSDLEGAPPRYGPEGASVQGELADGTPFSLPFDDTPRARPARPAPAVARGPGPPPPPEPFAPPPPDEGPARKPLVPLARSMGAVRQLVREGKTSSAVEELERLRSAVHDDPAQTRRLADAEGELARALLDEGNPDEAKRYATIGVETDPEAPRPHEALGRISYARNDVPEAMGEWNRGLAPNPRDPPLLALVAKGQTELASLKTYRTRASDHFVLTFEGNEDRETADLALADLEEAYQKVTALYAFQPADKVPVVIYPDQAFSQLEGRARWANGMFDGKVRAGSSGASAHLRDFKRLLAHEYGHAILHRAVHAAAVPGWFNEGLAQLAPGTLESQPELTCSFGHGARLQALRGGFARLPGNDRQVWAAYLTARHAVERLISRKGMDAVREIIRRTGEGEPFDDAFEHSTSQGYAAFVEAFDRQDAQH